MLENKIIILFLYIFFIESLSSLVLLFTIYKEYLNKNGLLFFIQILVFALSFTVLLMIPTKEENLILTNKSTFQIQVNKYNDTVFTCLSPEGRYIITSLDKHNYEFPNYNIEGILWTKQYSEFRLSILYGKHYLNKNQYDSLKQNGLKEKLQ